MKLKYDNKTVNCLITDVKEHQQKNWIRGQFYEAHGNGLLHWAYARGFKNIIDVGASIGNHTLFFAGIMGAKVISIEPYEPSYLNTQSNVQLNNLESQVSMHNVACGSKEGRVKMQPFGVNNIGMTRSTPGDETRVVQLDYFLNKEIDYVKIDIEGDNINVLSGAKKLMSLNPVVSIECENESVLEDTNNFMSKYGYSISLGIKLNPTPTYIWTKE